MPPQSRRIKKLSKHNLGSLFWIEPGNLTSQSRDT
jgi:hypothetical protein